jgi:hypothetical protein
VKRRRKRELGNEAPMVITPRMLLDLVRRIRRRSR